MTGTGIPGQPKPDRLRVRIPPRLRGDRVACTQGSPRGLSPRSKHGKVHSSDRRLINCQARTWYPARDLLKRPGRDGLRRFDSARARECIPRRTATPAASQAAAAVTQGRETLVVPPRGIGRKARRMPSASRLIRDRSMAGRAALDGVTLVRPQLPEQQSPAVTHGLRLRLRTADGTVRHRVTARRQGTWRSR